MTPVTIEQAQTFLQSHLAAPPQALALIGEGAWSRCFGFRHNDQALAIRFGRYVDDFEKDRLAHRYAAPVLPIPEVLDIGAYENGYYAISTRVYGTPLEMVGSAQWRTLAPALVAALETMRAADIATTSGFGGWGADGNAPSASWRDHLLAVNRDAPDRRTYGWRQRLATFSPEGEAAFVWGYDLLHEVASDAMPRTLLHCDLMNRNVLVDATHITGVFDWGCSLYGDHLYELAWFEFWAPWTPQLDIPYFQALLEARWQDVGYEPEDKASRLAACYLHIGLAHLAYNAHLGDWETLAATAARMETLVRVTL